MLSLAPTHHCDMDDAANPLRAAAPAKRTVPHLLLFATKSRSLVVSSCCPTTLLDNNSGTIIDDFVILGGNFSAVAADLFTVAATLSVDGGLKPPVTFMFDVGPSTAAERTFNRSSTPFSTLSWSESVSSSQLPSSSPLLVGGNNNDDPFSVVAEAAGICLSNLFAAVSSSRVGVCLECCPWATGHDTHQTTYTVSAALMATATCTRILSLHGCRRPLNDTLFMSGTRLDKILHFTLL